MEQNELIEKEEIISESTDKIVTLTTHRIRYQASSWGQAHIVSIMLKNISSIEVHYESYVTLFSIGVLAVIAGVIMGLNGEQHNLGMYVLIAGALCIVIYWLTRKHVISIASDGGAKIKFETQGMKTDAVMEFINKVERAKSKVI